MTYSSGNTILATDYNTFVGTVNTVIGNSASYQSSAGYGQTTIASVSASGTVNASEWATLIAAVKLAATHQGTTINLPATALATGNTIEALDGTTSASGTYDLSTAVTNISANKNNVDAAAQSTISAANVMTRGSAWTDTINAEWYIQFASQVAADAFFNTGGEIHCSMTHPTGAGAQDVDWRAILQTKIGTMKMSRASFTRTGSAGTVFNVGYTSLTGTYQSIFTGTNIGAGQYAANDIVFNAKLDTSNHRVYFNVTLTDAHVPIAPSTVDSVSAGTTIDVGYRKSSTYTIATPTATTAEAL